jgi:predicted exporter
MGNGFALPAWLVVVLAALTLLILVRFGGLVAIRYLIPVAIAALVVFSVVRLGREQEWW